jgi:nitroimidazol reductase NimA-like FMN-containing flavoprotein (pyridoxamine 5'-phosphate oxidase superfamily)
MLIHELTLAECRGVLGHSSYGRLGCARADQPYVVPFSFQYDAAGDCLYSFSAVGQKIDWMRDNPMVCVEVDEVVDQFNWTSIVAFGRYEEMGDSPQDEGARRRAHSFFQQRSAWWLPALGKSTGHEEPHRSVVYRIAIHKLTGRRAVRAR